MPRESAHKSSSKSHSGNKSLQSSANTPTKADSSTTTTTTTMDELKTLLEANLQQLNNKYELITERIDTLTTAISNQHTDLKEDLLHTDKKAQLALDLATKNEASISDETKSNNENQDKIRILTLQLNQLNSQLDDQVNRGLRTTLIFRDIPQGERQETWDQTTTVLAKSLKSVLPGISEESIKAKIERAHRAKSTSNIIAKFSSWKDSESITKSLINYNRKAHDKSKLFYVSQMYSKELTNRRDEALKLRKELIQANKNTTYILTYPAKLMHRKKGSNARFELLQEF